ncbi:MAG: hypothetical protein K2K24_04015, partial [Clostridia bacterium]|nr:hypothetical protein [Clostridia bacterium]
TMAFMVKYKSKQEEYANYEREIPERDIYFRQANPNQGQGYGYFDQNNGFNSQYSQQSYGYQQNATPRFVSSYYQDQVERFLANGQMPNQNNYNRNGGFVSPQEQYRYDMYMGENYDRNAQVNRIKDQRSGKMKKRNVNSDIIKIVVTVMVVAVLICGLLIANQFLSNKEASAESDIIQPVDSVAVTSASTANGSEVMQQIELIPEYEYEQSTNWFDKVCDFFGGKLK